MINKTPLIKTELFGIKNLYIKDETKHPNNTFKDRSGYGMIKPFLEYPEPITFGCISYGNMAISMGHHTKILNQKHPNIANCIIFIPTDLNKRKFGPDTNNKTIQGKEVVEKIKETCHVIKLDLDKEYYDSEKLKQITKEHKLLRGKFIDLTEGPKVPSYRQIFEEILEDIEPDYIIIPFGAGILCNETIDVIKENNCKTKVVPVAVGRKDSVAVMLYGPYWFNTEELEKTGKTKSKHESHPCIINKVSDEEILEAIQIIKSITTAEPSGAAGFAILKRLKDIHPEFNPETNSVVVINTGNGLLNYKTL
jgi:threonine dehydratase